MSINKLSAASSKAFNELTGKDPLRMAAATAFFTTFALPGLLLILIEIIGIFYNPDTVKHNIFTQLIAVMGKESSVKVYEILNQFVQLAQNWFFAAAGFIFLLFVVTTLFNVIRKSINDLWDIGVDSHPGIKFNIKLRLKSTLLILFAGIVLAAQLIATALQILLKDYINEVWANYSSFLYKSITQVIFVVIASGWFAILFKYLANAHPTWRTAFAGGIVTGILFTVGKIILSALLTFDTLKEIFGKSGALVLILLFVFYCSFLFYFGAAFTKTLAEAKDEQLQLDEHAFVYEIQKIRQ